MNFFFSTIWLLDALKRIDKIYRESAFEQIKEKETGLKFKPGLAINLLWITGLRISDSKSKNFLHFEIRITLHGASS